jgi:competence protein ComEA
MMKERVMDAGEQVQHGRRAARLRRAMATVAMAALVALASVTWLAPRPALAGPKALPGATAASDDDKAPARGGKKEVSGKLNLNTATVDQLMLLPGVGPSKAERVVAWRGKNGPFKRVADLRKVKGFGYKTLKKLEPFLDIKGESTLAAK